MKVIIIGGVAGGATTAARIRRVDEAAEIILMEKGKYISYANCGLPYYIGGVIEEREKLFVQTPEAFSTRFRVDVRTENEVIFIDRKRKTVTVRRSSEDTYQESYDKLLISTGASPVRPPLPGIDLNGIFISIPMPPEEPLSSEPDLSDSKWQKTCTHKEQKFQL